MLCHKPQRPLNSQKWSRCNPRSPLGLSVSCQLNLIPEHLTWLSCSPSDGFSLSAMFRCCLRSMRHRETVSCYTVLSKTSKALSQAYHQGAPVKIVSCRWADECGRGGGQSWMFDRKLNMDSIFHEKVGKIFNLSRLSVNVDCNPSCACRCQFSSR